MKDAVSGEILPCDIPPGLQLLEIVSLKKAVSPKTGQVIMRNNNYLIDITFKNEEGKTGVIRASAGEKSQWIFDNLCNVVRVDNLNKTPSTKELIGKKLYVVCRAYINIVDGVNNSKIESTELIPKFYMYNPGLPKPKTLGDPSLPNVRIGGEYLVHNIFETIETPDDDRQFGDM